MGTTVFEKTQCTLLSALRFLAAVAVRHRILLTWKAARQWQRTPEPRLDRRAGGT